MTFITVLLGFPTKFSSFVPKSSPNTSFPSVVEFVIKFISIFSPKYLAPSYITIPLGALLPSAAPASTFILTFLAFMVGAPLFFPKAPKPTAFPYILVEDELGILLVKLIFKSEAISNVEFPPTLI